MLHVVGDADDIVPVKENTEPFEKRVKAAGGNINVIHKPGVNHHPHSLQDPTPITNFILAATGQKTNFAAIAAPGSEYRSGAGWIEGKGWWAQKSDIDSLIQASNPDIIFLGNSITQGTGGHRTYVTYKPGFSIFDSLFSNYKWENAGISGDRTQNILFRLQNGTFKYAQPKVIVVTIGVNNFIDNDSPEEIVTGIMAIAQWIKDNMPLSKLILTGPLPTGLRQTDERRKKFEQIHALLAKRSHHPYLYLPLYDIFTLTNGDLDPLKYASDGIHLLPGGYRIWGTTIQSHITKLMRKQN
ncbi:GDSL-type esterase/lipase family protein [Niabella hibiscisoli]|uniref:GDSL-type esterase/lipase family protein n=1 Tax=Niabella hibiscisoli TaxID=1825928 RepID=UPI001F0FFCAA|nr:GDSL-type esterase/lipase family protein [Niabella hibiscisoli]MCH5719263.1 GDSL-type esterase/lipase family protein [Niabella hibiscisoli]